MATIRGGNKIEAALKEIAKKLSKPATLEVGFMEGSTYPDGTPVPLVAAVQEFGAPARNIPPRPFFRNMIAAKHGEWPAGITAALKANDYDAAKALEIVGEGIKGQLQQSILDTNSPPLSQATIDRKGFDKALVDTGHMINSVTSRVRD